MLLYWRTTGCTAQYLEISNKHRTSSKSVWITFLSTREIRTGLRKHRHIVVSSQRTIKKPELTLQRIFLKFVNTGDFFLLFFMQLS